MSFNPDRTKLAQEAIFSRKTNESVHPPLFINNATVKLTHALKHLDLHLDSKLSFNEHTNNKISKATKGIGFLRKLQHILPHRSLSIIYKYFIRRHLDYGDVMTNRHHLQTKLNQCSITWH